MKIGLIANSQGDVDALEYACDLLIDEKGAERIFFLGGRWNDVDELFQRKRAEIRGRPEYATQDFLSDVASFLEKSEAEAKGGVAHRLLTGNEAQAYVRRFVRVPDAESLQYRDPSVSRILPELVGDRITCLVHDKADLRREDIEMAVYLLYGKSPTPEVVPIGPRFFVSPGSLTGAEQRSFGLLTLEAAGVEFAAFGLDGRETKRASLNVASKRKMSVK